MTYGVVDGALDGEGAAVGGGVGGAVRGRARQGRGPAVEHGRGDCGRSHGREEDQRNGLHVREWMHESGVLVEGQGGMGSRSVTVLGGRTGRDDIYFRSRRVCRLPKMLVGGMEVPR